MHRDGEGLSQADEPPHELPVADSEGTGDSVNSKVAALKTLQLILIQSSAYIMCPHERPVLDPKTKSCLLCIVVAEEHKVTVLKVELDAAHDRLAELEGEVLLERSNHRSTSIGLGRAKERIVSPR